MRSYKVNTNSSLLWPFANTAQGVDGQLIRQRALDIYAHLRTTSGLPRQERGSPRHKQKQSQLRYDERTSLAYLAGVMPQLYGATETVLRATKTALESLGDGWQPERVVDYGSGTATVAWALREVWGPLMPDGTARSYVGLDGAEPMIQLSSALLGALSPIGVASSGAPRLQAQAYQLPLPASQSALAKLQLAPNRERGKRTLAVAAFLLGDVRGPDAKRAIVKSMWDSGAEVMVIIERGTPAGSRLVIDAREQLLNLGRHHTDAEGSYVLAPCPHSGSCPLARHPKRFCHFSRQMHAPDFLRKTKQSAKGEADCKFSYVVVRRGARPPSASNRMGEQGLRKAVSPIAWPRVLEPPMKRSGHVVMEVCAPNGHAEQHIVPKSQGRQEYYDARKARWGDSFPHPPKNGGKLASAGAGALEADPTDDAAVARLLATESGGAVAEEEEEDYDDDEVFDEQTLKEMADALAEAETGGWEEPDTQDSSHEVDLDADELDAASLLEAELNKPDEHDSLEKLHRDLQEAYEYGVRDFTLLDSDATVPEDQAVPDGEVHVHLDFDDDGKLVGIRQEKDGVETQLDLPDDPDAWLKSLR